MKRPMGKRTRRIKKWIITVPHVAIREPGVYRLTMKVSQVTYEKVKEIPKHREGVPTDLGEGKDRGSIDAEENSSEAKDE